MTTIEKAAKDFLVGAEGLGAVHPDDHVTSVRVERTLPGIRAILTAWEAEPPEVMVEALRVRPIPIGSSMWNAKERLRAAFRAVLEEGGGG
jgi:hypothetical protein